MRLNTVCRAKRLTVRCFALTALCFWLAVPLYGQHNSADSKSKSSQGQSEVSTAQHSQEETETRGPKTGKLILHGGGKGKGSTSCFPLIEAWARENVMEGEALNVVVIPTADSDFEGTFLQRARIVFMATFAMGRNGNIKVRCLHTRDRKTANSESFCRPLEEAHIVVIPGGYQRLINEAYAGTRLHDSLWKVLDRGGIIAGASAGAIVQGSVFSRTPAGKKGFEFLTNSIIDVHFSERNRKGYLVKKFRNKKFDQEYLGIGIDEEVMVVIEQDTLEVYGDNNVFIVDPRKSNDDNTPACEKLSDGDRYDLRNRKTISSETD